MLAGEIKPAVLLRSGRELGEVEEEVGQSAHVKTVFFSCSPSFSGGIIVWKKTKKKQL